MKVKTRFAPSPTGFLHVGGVRTALFSWLYARHCQGQFLLRIEDTDQERSTEASVAAILEGMKWLGLDYDEGPIFQTERNARYQEVAVKLLQEKKAYRCNCSKQRLEALRESQLAQKIKPRYDGHCRNLNLAEKNSEQVIRFKNPQEGNVHFQDAVYGDITVANDELDDLVLIRSDGYPTYNFAVVIDDMDMDITHVIRGDDHINNTPRQINLFQALNATVPIFAHLPMILGDDGKRLSKRHGAVSVLQFKEAGFLPQALLNYLVRLGWSLGNQEIFSLSEMIAHFDLTHISRGTASFNYEKLNWLNQHYLKEEPSIEVAKALKPYFDAVSIDTHQGPSLESLVALQANRCKNLIEMRDSSRYFYEDSIDYNSPDFAQFLTPSISQSLQTVLTEFEKLSIWEKETIQIVIKTICKQFDMKMPQLAQPLRLIMTGGLNSPSIDSTIALIGKERSLKRLELALHYIAEQDK